MQGETGCLYIVLGLIKLKMETKEFEKFGIVELDQKELVETEGGFLLLLLGLALGFATGYFSMKEAME